MEIQLPHYIIGIILESTLALANKEYKKLHVFLKRYSLVSKDWRYKIVPYLPMKCILETESPEEANESSLIFKFYGLKDLELQCRLKVLDYIDSLWSLMTSVIIHQDSIGINLTDQNFIELFKNKLNRNKLTKLNFTSTSNYKSCYKNIQSLNQYYKNINIDDENGSLQEREKGKYKHLNEMIFYMDDYPSGLDSKVVSTDVLVDFIENLTDSLTSLTIETLTHVIFNNHSSLLRIKQLEHLKLSCKIDVDNIIDFINNFKSLKSIHIHNNYVERVNDDGDGVATVGAKNDNKIILNELLYSLKSNKTIQSFTLQSEEITSQPTIINLSYLIQLLNENQQLSTLNLFISRFEFDIENSNLLQFNESQLYILPENYLNEALLPPKSLIKNQTLRVIEIRSNNLCTTSFLSLWCDQSFIENIVINSNESHYCGYHKDNIRDHIENLRLLTIKSSYSRFEDASKYNNDDRVLLDLSSIISLNLKRLKDIYVSGSLNDSNMNVGEIITTSLSLNRYLQILEIQHLRFTDFNAIVKCNDSQITILIIHTIFGSWNISEFKDSVISNRNLENITVTNIHTPQLERESISEYMKNMIEILNSNHILQTLRIRSPISPMKVPKDELHQPLKSALKGNKKIIYIDSYSEKINKFITKVIVENRAEQTK